MGKPRKKGMRKGYLKQYSSQAINNGKYSPHKPTLAEYSRRPRSLGFVNPKTGTVSNMQEIPPTKGATEPVRERVKRWELFTHNERHQIKLEDIKACPAINNGKIKLPLAGHRLFFCGAIWFWTYEEEEGKIMKRSITYHSAKRSEQVFYTGSIEWFNSE